MELRGSHIKRARAIRRVVLARDRTRRAVPKAVSLAMHVNATNPDACIARYENVCVSQIRSGRHRLHFAAGRSACDGQACSVQCARNDTPEARRCSCARFPIGEHLMQEDPSVWYEPVIALLPSLPTGKLSENMAHFLYDTLLLEAEIWLRTNGGLAPP